MSIVGAAILAIAFGVVFYAWDRLWAGTESLFTGFPPGRAAIAGVWFLPAVLGPLVIRKPGAGVFTETVAAAVSALLGAQWGLVTVLYGLVQGVGGEAPFAATGYRNSRLVTALVGGALAGAGWLLTRALARTGVLDRFPSGRERVAV